MTARCHRTYGYAGLSYFSDTYVQYAYVILPYVDLMFHERSQDSSTGGGGGGAPLSALLPPPLLPLPAYRIAILLTCIIVDLMMGDARKFFHDCNEVSCKLIR